MNNTMYVDVMTKTCGKLMKGSMPAQGGAVRSYSVPGNSFMDKLMEKSEKIPENPDISEPVNLKEISPKDMTMEEYKQYIYDKISGLPISDSQINCSFSVNITEEGFEAMKNDPEYEEWVLATLQYDFSFHDPWAELSGGRYVIHSFGADKEEYVGRNFSKGVNINDRKKEKSFWEKRQERRKKLLKQLEEAQTKKAIWKRVVERELSQAKYENMMIARRETGLPLQVGYVRTELAQAYGMYEMFSSISLAARKMN